MPERASHRCGGNRYEITLALVIVGGLNSGLVSLFGFDLVATIFSAASVAALAVYGRVGASAVWQIVADAKIVR